MITPGGWVFVLVAIAVTIESAVVVGRNKRGPVKMHGYYCEQGHRRYWDDD